MLLERLDTVIAFVAILLGVSLLIMIATQAISALLNLRGSSLSTGLKILFTTSGMEPSRAKKLTSEILHHELISDTSRSAIGKSHRSATTIRDHELENILDVIEREEVNEIRSQNRKQIERLEDDVASCERALEACQTASDRDEHDEATMKTRLARLKKELHDLKERIERELAEKRKQLQALKAHVAIWFDAVMDRTSQRFVRGARVVTAILSLVTALALHLDALTLYDQLARDNVMRDSMVASTNQLVGQAENMLDADATVVPTAYRAALEELRALTPAEIERVIGAEAVEPVASLPLPATAIASRRDAEIWLYDELGDIPEEVKKSALAAYRKYVEARLSGALERLRESAIAIKDDLDAAEFRLIPTPYPSPLTYFRGGMHLLGTLAMAALLSLGAPFWFDALKKLMSVRPVLAGKVERERREKSQKPGAAPLAIAEATAGASYQADKTDAS